MNKPKCYIGIDIGSISTKGVVINEQHEIIDSIYIETQANPIAASKKVAEYLKEKTTNYQVKGIGTTGSARKLIGLMLDANIVKNEITAHAIGTMELYPDVSTILEIGGQDSKIILIENGMIKDYAMNTLCAAGTGAFLTSQAKRLHIPIEEFGNYAIQSTNPVNIAARCTVFAESDLIHKAQMGYEKKDIIAGLCRSIVLNYLNNVARGKKIKDRVVFQGGVSKNIGVQKYFKEILQKDFKGVSFNKRLYVIKHYILFTYLTGQHDAKYIKNQENKMLYYILLLPGILKSKKIIKNTKINNI